MLSVFNMNRSALSLVLLTTLCFALFFIPRIGIVKADKAFSVYIRADGSVDPPTASIQRNGDMYTLNDSITTTANNVSGIVIERDNMTLDGVGHTLQGTGWGTGYATGIDLSYRNNVTIANMEITEFYDGILLNYSSNTSISADNVTANSQDGSALWFSSGNISVSGNNITSNSYGVDIQSSSGNISVSGNNITSNSYGVDIQSSSGSISVSGNSITSNSYGVDIRYCSDVSVSGNSITNNAEGIFLGFSNATTISENNVTANIDRGIDLLASSGDSISGNNITANNNFGIDLEYSCNNNSISGNNITSNGHGIYLSDSYGNVLRDNSMVGNSYAFEVHAGGFSGFVNDIDVTNTVDDKPIYYWLNEHDRQVPLDAGYVGLVNCSGITVQNLNLAKNGQGVLLVNTTNSKITENNITNNRDGVALDSSNGNNISGNNITNNEKGTDIDSSADNSISGNNVTNNQDGISLRSCSNSSIYGNNVTSNGVGIILEYCSGNSISGNNITANNDYGVHLDSSTNISISGNSVTTRGGEGIALDYSNDSSISDNNITNNYDGIYFRSSTDNSVSGNSITNNVLGVNLWAFSTNNTFAKNNITANNSYGISLKWCFNETFYYNNIMNNTHQVYSYNSTNAWDDGYPSGGNYWSDYNGSDVDGDGIGDTPYQVGGSNDSDRYPLMAPISVFSAGSWNGTQRDAYVATNSTVSNFQVNTSKQTLSFNVSGVEGTSGFCRVTIPSIIVQQFWHGNYTVLLNNKPWPFRNWTGTTNTYIYVNYTHSEHQVTIIPEFPLTLILPSLALTTLSAAIIYKRKHLTNLRPFTDSEQAPVISAVIRVQ